MNREFFSKPAVLAPAVVAFVAAALYIVIDAPDEVPAVNRTALATQPMASQETGKKSASVTSLVGGLEARLAENPDDAKGWLLLAKSHDHLGDRDAAWDAYSRAKELGMSDDTFEMQLAANLNQLIQKN
jgi:cytochrome c-type biogenesis protein CcmH